MESGASKAWHGIVAYHFQVVKMGNLYSQNALVVINLNG